MSLRFDDDHQRRTADREQTISVRGLESGEIWIEMHTQAQIT